MNLCHRMFAGGCMTRGDGQIIYFQSFGFGCWQPFHPKVIKDSHIKTEREEFTNKRRGYRVHYTCDSVVLFAIS